LLKKLPQPIFLSDIADRGDLGLENRPRPAAGQGFEPGPSKRDQGVPVSFFSFSVSIRGGKGLRAGLRRGNLDGSPT